MSDPVKDLVSLLRKEKIDILFWTCPKGCAGRVKWSERDRPNPIATCMVCGLTNYPQIIESKDAQIARLTAELAEAHKFQEQIDGPCLASLKSRLEIAEKAVEWVLNHAHHTRDCLTTVSLEKYCLCGLSALQSQLREKK